MNGGKVLWCIDAVNVCLDSLVNGITFAIINDLNLEDILFRYGVRINPNLIQDIQCNVLHLEVDYPGANPKPMLAPWLYYPLISCLPVHPVTKNLNMIKTEFVNSIDTVGSGKSIRKTVLLKSSRYSKLISVPTMINLEEINKELRQEEFGNSYQSVAVLMEGQFESAFKNRILTGYFKNNVPDFKEKSTDNNMLVISDGDIIRNDFKLKANGTLILPLGYDKYTGRTFGNKDFIINAIHYLTDNNGLVNIRSREIKLRLLDRTKIKDNNRLKWQLINTILPLLIIILFGLLYNYSRRLKYS
jgi:ABC-2 type transport system permease protein